MAGPGRGRQGAGVCLAQLNLLAMHAAVHGAEAQRLPH